MKYSPLFHRSFRKAESVTWGFLFLLAAAILIAWFI